MNRKLKINLAIIFAMVASLGLVMADVLMLGFESNPDDYPLFSKRYVDELDVNISTLFLQASTQQLSNASLLIALSTPFLLPGMWLVRRTFLDPKSSYATVVYFGLMAGAALTPLLHAKFYFIGEIHKIILATDAVAHPQLIATAKSFTKTYYTGWAVAFIVIALSWIAFTFAILLNKTRLPRLMVLASPLVLLILVNLFIKFLLPNPVSVLFSGAGLSLSYLLFFGTLGVFFKQIMIVD